MYSVSHIESVDEDLVWHLSWQISDPQSKSFADSLRRALLTVRRNGSQVRPRIVVRKCYWGVIPILFLTNMLLRLDNGTAIQYVQKLRISPLQGTGLSCEGKMFIRQFASRCEYIPQMSEH